MGSQPGAALAVSLLPSLLQCLRALLLPAYYSNNRKLQVFCGKCLFTSYISQTTY